MNRVLPMRFFEGVSDEQGEKLLEIAKNCPAARLLAGEIILDTALEADAS